MKRLLLTILLTSILSTSSWAQCNGIFPNNTVCGNITGANNTPRATSPSAFLGAAGGTNGQIQYNNAGALGGFTASGDATVNTSTGAVSVTQVRGVPVDPTSSSTNDVLSYNGTTYVHKALLTLINAVCVVSPTGCTALFGYASPLWWGAACDGVTDDHVALQNAITASAGKLIQLPPSTCWTGNTTLTLPSQTTINGIDREQSIISGNSWPLLSSTNTTNITLTNFWLKGTDNVVSWAVSHTGVLVFTQDASTVVNQHYVMTGMKFSNFNTSYWISISSTTTTFNTLYDITFENNLLLTSSLDIPTDGVSTNNTNYGFIIGSSSGGHGRIDNLKIKNNRFESIGMCFPISVFGNSYRTQITENIINDVGQTSPTHCLSGDLVTILSYGVNIYDAYGDGNPPTNFLVSSNSIIAPYGTGIYVVGDGTGGHTAAVYNSSGSLIDNNLIDGQVAQTDVSLGRGGIVVANLTDMAVIGNHIRNSFGGIVATTQTAGQVSIIGNVCETSVPTTTSTPFCYKLAAGPNDASVRPNFTLKANYGSSAATASGAAILVGSATGSRFGNLEISDNTIVAAFNGLSAANNFVTGLWTISNNKFEGAAAGTMFNISTLNGSALMIRDNSFFNNVSGVSGITFANLPIAVNGSNVFLTDGAPASGPCTGTSTGSTAFRQNGAWKCF